MKSPLRRVFDMVAIFVVFAYLAPLYWVAITSVKPTQYINSRSPRWDFPPTFEHYENLFERFFFSQAIFNSMVIAVLATVLTILLAVPASYALTRMGLRRGEQLSLSILSLRFMPGVVVALPYFIAYQKFGLIDTHAGLILIYVGIGLPFAIWLIRGFLQDIPRDLEEAAHLDGLGFWATLVRIIVPIARPGIAVVAIFTFVFNWNEFLFALYITQSKVITMPIQIAKMIDLYNVLWGEVSAAIVIQLVPMIVIVFFIQRHMIRGLALGAVK